MSLFVGKGNKSALQQQQKKSKSLISFLPIQTNTDRRHPEEVTIK